MVDNLPINSKPNLEEDWDRYTRVLDLQYGK